MNPVDEAVINGARCGRTIEGWVSGSAVTSLATAIALPIIQWRFNPPLWKSLGAATLSTAVQGVGCFILALAWGYYDETFTNSDEKPDATNPAVAAALPYFPRGYQRSELDYSVMTPEWATVKVEEWRVAKEQEQKMQRAFLGSWIQISALSLAGIAIVGLSRIGLGYRIWQSQAAALLSSPLLILAAGLGMVLLTGLREERHRFPLIHTLKRITKHQTGEAKERMEKLLVYRQQLRDLFDSSKG
ncbi:MAG: hypothetical protein AB7F31_01355 [Parachlamydiales bacterium]